MANAQEGWTIEKIGAAIGILVVVGGAVLAWGNLTSKVDRLEDRLARVSMTSANDLCLAVVQRQIAAIESENAAVQSKLAKLANEHRCLTRFAAETATTKATPAQETAAWQREELDRTRIEGSLGAIDEELNTHRNDDLIYRVR